MTRFLGTAVQNGTNERMEVEGASLEEVHVKLFGQSYGPKPGTVRIYPLPDYSTDLLVSVYALSEHQYDMLKALASCEGNRPLNVAGRLMRQNPSLTEGIKREVDRLQYGR